MTSELLASGALGRVANPPAVLAISRIVNNTGQQIDIDLLTKKIRVALLQSGKAVTTTTMGLGGTAEDPMAQGLQQENEFKSDVKSTRTPDFTLSGKIIQTRRQGRQHQPVHLQLPAFADRPQVRPGGLGRRKGNHQAGHALVGGLLTRRRIYSDDGLENFRPVFVFSFLIFLIWTLKQYLLPVGE